MGSACRIAKCNPCSQGFKEVRCETCGLASLGDAGQEMLDASVTSGAREVGARLGRRHVLLQGWETKAGGGTASLTWSQLKSLKCR